MLSLESFVPEKWRRELHHVATLAAARTFFTAACRGHMCAEARTGTSQEVYHSDSNLTGAHTRIACSARSRWLAALCFSLWYSWQWQWSQPSVGHGRLLAAHCRQPPQCEQGTQPRSDGQLAVLAPRLRLRLWHHHCELTQGLVGVAPWQHPHLDLRKCIRKQSRARSRQCRWFSLGALAP